MLNKRICKKKSKQALHAALTILPLIENGYHWTKERFQLNSGECLLQKFRSEKFHIDAKISYSIALYSLIGAPKLALSILSNLNRAHPERCDIITELLECSLEVGDIEYTKDLHDKFSNLKEHQNVSIECDDYINNKLKWEHYCAPGGFRDAIELIMTGNFEKVIKSVHGVQNLESNLLRLYMEAVRNDANEYIKQLSYILKTYSDIRRNYRFWFFRPKHILDNNEYKKLIRHENFSKYGVLLT